MWYLAGVWALQETAWCQVTGMLPGLRDFVQERGEGLPCARPPQARHCHLSGTSCSSTAGSRPWAGKEQPSEVGRRNCSLTPVPHGSFVCPSRPPAPSEGTACELSCCAPASSPCTEPALCSAPELQRRTVKTTSPKNNLCFRGWKM